MPASACRETSADRFAGADFVAAVDPVNPEAQSGASKMCRWMRYDAVLACIPDEPKIELLGHLLGHGKHVLVEKPLWAARREGQLERLGGRWRRTTRVVCYTAYNHRFEPHFVRMRDLIESGGLARIYRCRMFYGNGTARLVRDSQWRDHGAGVLPDLGSHLLDTARFWFGERRRGFSCRFEPMLRKPRARPRRTRLATGQGRSSNLR